MKKFMFFILALTLLLTSACGKETAMDPTPAQNTQTISKYQDDNLSFDIPEIWQKNFKAVTRNVGSSGDTYPQTDFYYTEGERDIRLMSIGKFTRDQWDKMAKDGKVGDDSKLGESGDKNHVYSIFYENHDYIEDTSLRDSLSKIKTEAEAIRNKMMIN